MKIFSFRIKKTNKRKTFLTNAIIFSMLFVVLAFSYVGGTLQVFNRTQGEEAIYFGDRNSNKVSLMVNVYWGDEFIQPMLDIFEEKNCTTTFFVGGVWASKNSEMLNKIIEYGHEIGNHGYYHKDQNKISEEENYKEISQTHQIVKSLAGVEMTLFAPPSGAYNNTTLTVATSLGYKTIMWTLDTIDWRDQDKNLITSRATKNAKGGDLILMHPTAKTLEALPDIIDTLKAKGLEIAPVTETLGISL